MFLTNDHNLQLLNCIDTKVVKKLNVTKHNSYINQNNIDIHTSVIIKLTQMNNS